jgi:hypothetical protein
VAAPSTRSFALAFALGVLLFLVAGHVYAKGPASEPLPALVLREAETGASLALDHACLLDASAEQTPACAVFQKKSDEEPESEHIDGKRSAIVRFGDDPTTRGARFLMVTLASVQTPGLDGEARARGVLKAMKGVSRSSVVTLGADRFLRVTSELPKGASVMYLAIDRGERQLAIDFVGLKGWRAEELEETAAAVMKTFARSAIVPAAPAFVPRSRPSGAASSASPGASLLGALVLIVIIGGPFALFGLRLVIRSSMRSRAQALAYRAAAIPQLVGADCAACNESIVFERDGVVCRMCGGPIHHRCADAHGQAHGYAPMQAPTIHPPVEPTAKRARRGASGIETFLDRS